MVSDDEADAPAAAHGVARADRPSHPGAVVVDVRQVLYERAVGEPDVQTPARIDPNAARAVQFDPGRARIRARRDRELVLELAAAGVTGEVDPAVDAVVVTRANVARAAASATGRRRMREFALPDAGSLRVTAADRRAPRTADAVGERA